MHKNMNWAVAWYDVVIAKFWLWDDANKFVAAQDEDGYTILEINYDMRNKDEIK